MILRLPHFRFTVLALVLLGVGAAASSAQWQRGRGRYRPPADRGEYPTWRIDEGFQDDVFTFVRIQYGSYASVVDSRWDNDFPDADWNFSFRLQQLTSFKVDPNGKVLRLTDPKLFDYPFIFILGARDLYLSEDETTALRQYLTRGGFLMVDDFWAPQEWEQLYRQMQRVFPGLEPRELSLDHDIFHIVYDLKEKPQVPSINAWRRGWMFEYWHGDPQGDEAPHFWGYFDKDDRLMALMCHNNDICDGWEREGENHEYFEKFSEKYSYPLGINIVTYAMSH